MLFSLDGYEKFSPKYPRLFTRPGEIIVLKVAPFTSEETLILGILTGTITLIFLAIPFIQKFSGVTAQNITGIQTPHLIALGISVLITGMSRRGMNERKEHGGIHPQDTLYLFSKEEQEVKEQKGGTETRIGGLQETVWNIKMSHTKNHTNYKSQAHVQSKKITLATSTRKNEAEELLEKIKNTLGVT